MIKNEKNLKIWRFFYFILLKKEGKIGKLNKNEAKIGKLERLK